VIAGSWLKVSPARKTGSSSVHIFGQSAGAKEQICSGDQFRVAKAQRGASVVDASF